LSTIGAKSNPEPDMHPLVIVLPLLIAASPQTASSGHGFSDDGAPERPLPTNTRAEPADPSGPG
jgi:hypothetical protein